MMKRLETPSLKGIIFEGLFNMSVLGLLFASLVMIIFGFIASI